MGIDSLIIWGTIPWVLFLLVVLLILNGKGNEQNRVKKLFWCVFIFAAIRYGIGYDYFSYKYIIEGQGHDYQLERWEVLPRYLAVISGHYHYQLFFIVCSFLTIFPVYYVSKKISIAPVTSFSLFLLFPILFLDSLGVVRNGVACSMVLLTFYYLHIRKYKQSIFCLLVAIGFHLSAFIGLLIYPLYFFFHNKKFNIFIYLLSFVTSIALLPLIESYFSDLWLVAKMLNNIEKDIHGGGMMYFVFNMIALFNIFNWKKISSYSKDNKIYLTLINFGVCIWNVFLPIDFTTALRMSTFFLFFVIFLIPSYKFIFSNPIVYKGIILFFVLLFISSLALNILAYYGMNLNMSNIPYQVFFLEPSDLLYHVD